MRALATDPAARGLRDDAAVLVPRGNLVLTHDMLVEGVHFLSTDPPGDVAWKLVAVNLSDLAAKGATPRGVLLGYALHADADYNAAFVAGLDEALRAMDVPLVGGDTVAYRDGPRVLSLTAVGDAPAGGVPSRGGARAANHVWVSGTIGDAGLGLAIARGDRDGPNALLDAYRRPIPHVALGRALAPHVSAMMDVSDGLLIDLARMLDASGASAQIDLDTVPLSRDLVAAAGSDRSARLAAATAGDDYQLLFAAPVQADAAIAAIAVRLGTGLTTIGMIGAGAKLHLYDADGPIPLPLRLGYEHE